MRRQRSQSQPELTISPRAHQTTAGTLNGLVRVYLAIDGIALAKIAALLSIPSRRCATLIRGDCGITEDELQRLSIHFNHKKKELIDPEITATRIRNAIQRIGSTPAGQTTRVGDPDPNSRPNQTQLNPGALQNPV